MKKLFVIGLVATLATAQAEEAKTSESSSTSSTKLEAIKKNETPANTTGQADVDDVITNRRLRAEMGSKNKFSFSTYLSYLGGSLQKPGSKTRPNITGAVGTSIKATLSGSVNARMKMTPLTSLSFGAGIGMEQPFHDAKESRWERSFIANPNISLGLADKIAGIQSSSSVGATLATDNNAKSIGNVAYAGVDQTLMYDFGGSPLSVGIQLSAGKSFYNKAAGSVMSIDKKGNEVLYGSEQSDLDVSAAPVAELSLNDRFNLRTLYATSAQHMIGQDIAKWKKNTPYQSVGLGISVTRDIFVYPNIQFRPALSISEQDTNVGVSTYINL